MLPENSIDFLFIDGDHSYEGVKNDFEMYKPLVSKGGIIVLDDIYKKDEGVPKLWNELKQEHNCTEIGSVGTSPQYGLVKM